MSETTNTLPLPAFEGAFDDPQSPAYQPSPGDSHLDRSQAALLELVDVVNAAAAGQTTLRVCLHSVINRFAQPLLFIFNLELIDDGRFADPENLDEPFHMAVVANQPVEVQVEATLDMLAQFIERQERVIEMRDSDEPIDAISARVAAADRVGHEQTVDELRYGWRSAARSTARGAADYDLSLQLSYEPRFLDSTEQTRTRFPLLRRAYNKFDDFRELVDRMVGAIAGRESRVAGGPERARLWLQQRTAVSGTMQYFAQAMRDALVLGNGYVRFTDVEPIGAYNLRPEDAHPIDRFHARLLRSGEAVDRALVFEGFEQPGTAVGLGLGELMLGSLRQHDVVERSIREASQYVGRVSQAAPYVDSLRRLAETQEIVRRQRVQELFGWWVDHAPPAPDGLYFTGQERM